MMISKMASVGTIIPKYKCDRCGYLWIPRVVKVKTCPKCKSRLWNEAAERREEEQAAKNGRAR